jgi:hypothetical protein
MIRGRIYGTGHRLGDTTLRQDQPSTSRQANGYVPPQQPINEAALVPNSRVYFTASVLPEGERYVAGEIEDRIEQLLLEQLHEEPVRVACTLLCTANYKDGNKLVKCVKILNKFADDILDNPSEEQYRTIRVDDAIFRDNVIMFDLSYFNQFMYPQA